MTISTAPAPISYSGDGSTATFSITWKYFAKSHVVVTLRESDGDEVTWVLGTQYTLSDAGVATGGTLTVDTSPVDYTPANNETLLIELVVPNTQDSALPLGGPFPSTAVEDELDQSVQRDEKIQAVLDRCLRVPKTDLQTGSSLNLPIDSVRASQFLAFDADGKPIAAAGTSADLTAVSTYINTLLDDANFTTAILTLGLQPHYALGSVAGTNTITATAGTTLTAHVAGDLLTFVPANDNTGAVTLNVDSIGAGAVQLNGAALVIGELQSGMPVTVRVTNTTPLFEIIGGEPLSRRWTKGADVASATDALIGISGNIFDITGSVTIATLATKGIGTVVILHFDAAPTLTHHSTNLILPGGADISAAAGDEAVFYEYAAADWRCLSYTRALQQPGKHIVQTVNTVDSAVATGTTVGVFDDSIPESDEGVAFTALDTAITPKSTSNRLRIDVVVVCTNSASSGHMVVGLFQDSTVNAIAATAQKMSAAGDIMTIAISHEMAAGTTTATTFKIRAGLDGAGTTTYNGTAGGRKFGGVGTMSSMHITEIAA